MSSNDKQVQDLLERIANAIFEGETAEEIEARITSGGQALAAEGLLEGMGVVIDTVERTGECTAVADLKVAKGLLHEAVCPNQCTDGLILVKHDHPIGGILAVSVEPCVWCSLRDNLLKGD